MPNNAKQVAFSLSFPFTSVATSSFPLCLAAAASQHGYNLATAYRQSNH